MGDVIRLQRSLYRLKHAAKVWNKLLFNSLTSLGCTEMKTSPCDLIGEGMTMVFFVNDLFQFALPKCPIENEWDEMCKQFLVNDLDHLKRFCRMDWKWHLDGPVSLQKLQLVNKVVKNTVMDKWKRVGSPIDHSVFRNGLKVNHVDEYQNAKYWSFTEGLMYLATHTKSYLAIASSLLALHLHNSASDRMVSAKRVLRYRRETLEREMKINLDAATLLTTYIDSNWGRKVENSRQSYSGTVLMWSNAMTAVCLTLQNVSVSVPLKLDLSPCLQQPKQLCGSKMFPSSSI